MDWRYSSPVRIMHSVCPLCYHAVEGAHAHARPSISSKWETVFNSAQGENYVAEIDRQLTDSWREDRLLSFFLAFLVLMTIFVPMVGLSRPGRIVIDLTFALMLLSGAIATVYKRLLMYVIIVLTALEFSADLVVEFNPSFSPR